MFFISRCSLYHCRIIKTHTMKNLTFLNNQFSIDNDRADQIELIKQLQEDIKKRSLESFVSEAVKSKVREIYGNAVDCMSNESIQETYNDLTK